ncbi:Putative MAP kinase family protein [Zea mays]|uniref:mitogen-activated protein kinase n=1 Tax=Zea mays TaxID=4577 RepID=A0A1D6LNA6_MAIZE|nr:Putative MAP kinase family protein [Zea mays]
MGGGGAIVHGFRRWFHRRSGSTSNQSSIAGDGEGEADGGSPDLEIVDDPDLLGLRAIRVPKRKMPLPVESHRKDSVEMEFFTEYGEASQYQIQEVIGKGSYGVVAAAVDTRTGERVAIKKINDVFEHVSDATRILREIKLLRLLRHPDIVEIKHIMLPPSRREFQDIYVVFELMESDLHQVIKANDDLTPEHHQFFLYQLLRALKYIHAANVFHRDLKPKNILANSDCKLKICDFGLARASFNDAPSAIFWTDYVATRWYRAPELCGSFFSKYTPAIDIWSIGCIFAELLTGRPLFPGKNVVHQLDIITDLLGTPSSETLSRIRNEKARRYLSCMRKKYPVPFTHKFRNADPLALRLLERLLAFDPKDRPTAEEILEYHPQMLEEHMQGGEQISFLYPRERVVVSKDGDTDQHINDQERSADSVARTTVSPPRSEDDDMSDVKSTSLSSRSYLKSASISASKCVVATKKHPEVVPPPLLTFGFSARTMESLRKWKAPSMDCLKRSPGCTRKQDCPWQQQPCCKVSVSGTLYSDDSLGKANTVCHTAVQHTVLRGWVLLAYIHPQLVRLYLGGRGTHHRLMALSSSSAFPPCHASAAWHL